jgi:hypothetical protein
MIALSEVPDLLRNAYRSQSGQRYGRNSFHSGGFNADISTGNPRNAAHAANASPSLVSPTVTPRRQSLRAPRPTAEAQECSSPSSPAYIPALPADSSASVTTALPDTPRRRRGARAIAEGREILTLPRRTNRNPADAPPAYGVAEGYSNGAPMGVPDSELSAQLANLDDDSGAIHEPVTSGPLNSIQYWRQPPEQLYGLPKKVSRQEFIDHTAASNAKQATGTGSTSKSHGRSGQRSGISDASADMRHWAGNRTGHGIVSGLSSARVCFVPCPLPILCPTSLKVGSFELRCMPDSNASSANALSVLRECSCPR